MGSDMPTEQRLKGFVPLALLLTGSLDRGDFPEPAEGQMRGSNQSRASRRFYRPAAKVL
jgi:hypothetical protein